MKRFLLGTAMAISLVLCQGVQAKVLYLSTTEGAYGSLDDAAYNAFAADPVTASLGGIVDGRKRLSDTTAIPATLFDDVQVVVLGAITAAINSVHRPVLESAIRNRPDLTFLVFSDGCCQPTRNLDQLLGILGRGTGWTLGSPIRSGTTSSRA